MKNKCRLSHHELGLGFQRDIGEPVNRQKPRRDDQYGKGDLSPARKIPPRTVHGARRSLKRNRRSTKVRAEMRFMRMNAAALAFPMRSSEKPTSHG